MVGRAKGHWFQSIKRAKDAVDKPVFMDMCCEEKWYMAISQYIQPHHQLVSLHIELLDWHDIVLKPQYESWLENHEMTLPEDRATLLKWRDRLLNLFNDQLRGIRHPRLTQVGCEVLREREVQGITMAMTRPRNTAEKQVKPSRTLGEAFRAISSSKQQLGG